MRLGYTIAVPRPSRTLPTSHHPNCCVAAVRSRPAACTHMPATIEPLTPPAVAQGTGSDLQEAPGRWVDRLENADPLHAEAERGEEQREDAPAHPVVEVVHEPGLRGGEQVAVLERGERKDFPEADRSWRLCVSRGLQPHVVARVADEEDRQRGLQHRVADTEIDRCRSQPVLRG